MAGPTLMVKLLADVTGLGKSFDQAGTAGKSAADKMHGAFSSVLSTLNNSGILGPFGAALGTADEALSKLKGHGKEIAPVMMGAGGALLGLGATLQQLGSKDQAAHQQLQAAVQATGKSYDTYAGRVDAAIKKQEHFGTTAGTTQDALRILTQATGDPAKALDLLGTASDLAAAKHESLDAAAGQLGKTYNGAAKLMKEFGLTAVPSATKATAALERATKSNEAATSAQAKAHQHLSDVQAALSGKTQLTTADQIRLRDAQQNVVGADAKAEDAHNKLAKAQDTAKKATADHNANIDALSKKLKGQASASADTFSGKINALKAHVIDSATQLAQKYGPAITTAGAVMTGFGAALQVVTAIRDADLVSTIAHTAATTASAVATGVMTAAQWLLNAAMSANPIMIIVIALVALVAGIILAYQHCTIFRNIVDDMGRIAVAAFRLIVDAAKVVWDWISTHWPLILAILTGPFGMAVYLIATYWNQIVSFAASIPGRILGALSSLGGLLVSLGSQMISGLLSGITGAWNAVAGWFGGLGSRAMSAAAGTFDTLYNFGKHIIDGFISGIESMGSAVADKIKSVVTAPIDAAKSVLKIFSPSQVFADLGRQTMAGYVQGVDAMASAVNNSVVSALNTSPVSAATASNTASPAGGGSGPAVVVQNAHFNSDVDVDAFMQRAAWVARTRQL